MLPDTQRGADLVAGSGPDGVTQIALGRKHRPVFSDPQREIVERIDVLASDSKRLESIYQKKLTSLAELKQSLLQKAFSGELTAEFTSSIKEEALA